MMRIDKFLAQMGVCSRSEAKKLLKKGQITVNDLVIKSDDYKVDENHDTIKYLDKILKYEEFIYLMVNKPTNVVCATFDKKEKTILDLVSEYKNRNLFPFGRLDKDSVGLVILSDDGKLAHELLSPKKHVDKTYYLKVKGVLTDFDIASFAKGIVLEDNDVCKSAKLEILKSEEISECLVTLSEGKYHQLKRMFKMLNKEVIYLKRISFGKITLDSNLKEGEYRPLSEIEINALKN